MLDLFWLNGLRPLLAGLGLFVVIAAVIFVLTFAFKLVTEWADIPPGWIVAGLLLLFWGWIVGMAITGRM